MSNSSTRFPGNDYVFLGDVPLNRLIKIYEDAVDRFESKSEILDTLVTWKRNTSALTPSQILNIASTSRSLWTLVLREDPSVTRWEMCVSTLEDPAHFLYIFMNREEGNCFIQEHELEIIPKSKYFQY